MRFSILKLLLIGTAAILLHFAASEPTAAASEPMVFGVSPGRSGTDSLKTALNVLGYSTLHMKELLLDESGIDTSGRLQLFTSWATNYDKPNNPTNIDPIMEGFTAGVDFPISMFYIDLLNHYPNSKFILTHRNPKKWYNSIQSTICLIGNQNHWYNHILLHVPFGRFHHQFPMMDSIAAMISDKHDWTEFCNSGEEYLTRWFRNYEEVRLMC